ncbi:MAG: 6,7-dimethyl-8-ribityllumazine synthase [Candidatus Bathyarchaeia archaeon]
MAEPIRLAFVVSEFNYDISYLMLQRALEHAKFLEADAAYVVKTPGAFDMPIILQDLLEKKDVDGVVTLGAVVEGDTKHDEIVAQHVSRKIADLSVQHRKPVALGISGPGMTRMQGVERIDDFARRGVEAAVKLIKRRRELAKSGKPAAANYPVTIG